MAEPDKEIPSNQYDRELATDLDDKTPDKPGGMALHTKVLIGLLVGVVGGLAVNQFLGGDNPSVSWTISNITQPVGTLFLNLLLMIVVPLVFSSLVVGVAGIGDIRKLGAHRFEIVCVLSCYFGDLGCDRAWACEYDTSGRARESGHCGAAKGEILERRKNTD